MPGGANPTIPKCELITPQKQFLLLSQSLRHPDGSSNPELNVVQGEKVMESEAKRSPGNGKSDTEECDSSEPNGNLQEKAIIKSPSGNNNLVIESTASESTTPSKTSSKKSKFAAFKFFRLFGNNNSQQHQRAKSCENSNRKVQKIKSEHVKSASSSPIIKKQQHQP